MLPATAQLAAATAAGADGGSRRPRRSVLVEATLLLLSPLLVVWPLRAQLWATPHWIDPFMHTAVIQHGRDLLERYGTNNRQFARVGFTVPGRLFNIVFGDLGGYLAFRYALALLSVVPAYLLFRRLHGPAAGAVAIVAVLANPVVLQAWGSDYGDSSAVGYLIAGTCSLVMPATSPRRRLGWVAAAAVALSLALHSTFITLPLIGALVLAHAALTARRSWREASAHLAVLAAGLAATTGVLVLLSTLLYGVADIFSPTWKAYLFLRTPESTRVWHTQSAAWALEDPHLLLPPAMVAGWAAVRLRRGVPVPELTIVAAAALQFLAYGYLQFFNTEQTLEFFLYLSMLWPGVLLVSAFLVVAVARPLLDSPWTGWMPAALILLAPLALHPFRAQLVFRIPWTGLLITAGLVAIAALAAAARMRAYALVLCGALVIGCYLLLTGKDTHKPRPPGAAPYPPVRYAYVIDEPYGRQRDEYAAASQLHHVVPTPQRPGTPVLLWWTRDPFSSAVNIAAAQYGWNSNALRGNLPDLKPDDLHKIRQRKPDYLVTLSTTDLDFDAAVAALARSGFAPTVVRRTTLHHGSATVFVQVLRVASAGTGGASSARTGVVGPATTSVTVGCCSPGQPQIAQRVWPPRRPPTARVG
jgi:hypothetical protein